VKARPKRQTGLLFHEFLRFYSFGQFPDDFICFRKFFKSKVEVFVKVMSDLIKVGMTEAHKLQGTHHCSPNPKGKNAFRTRELQTAPLKYQIICADPTAKV
jgi:hypothetical protein